MFFPPAIEKFFKSISDFFSDLWKRLPYLLFRNKKFTYSLKADYWREVEKTVTGLLEEAYGSINALFSEEVERSQNDYSKINTMLERLSDFAQGKIATLEIENELEAENSNLLQAFQKAQKAHFILSLVAEMNVEGIDEVYPDDKNKPGDWKTFEKLFKNVRKKTEIKREIFKVINYGDDNEHKSVIFGSMPDGFCVDYCLDMRDRTETIEKIVHYLSNKDVKEAKRHNLKNSVLDLFRTDNSQDTQPTNYDNDVKLIKFIQDKMNSKQVWLSGKLARDLFSAMPEKETKSLHVWRLTHNSNTFQDQGGSDGENNFSFPTQRLHYLTTGYHASRIVVINDFGGLMTGKIHENRFSICQTGWEHAWYMGNYVEAFRP